MTIQTIVVGTDFSDIAHGAADWAVELARTLGARVILAHVFDLPIVGFPDAALLVGPETAARMSEVAQKALDADVARLRDRGVAVEAVLHRLARPPRYRARSSRQHRREHRAHVDDRPGHGGPREELERDSPVCTVGGHGDPLFGPIPAGQGACRRKIPLARRPVASARGDPSGLLAPTTHRERSVCTGRRPPAT